MLIEIREERPDDVAAIRDVNKGAFGQDQEGNIVDALRSNGAALLSLVATLNVRVLGHMYSPLTVAFIRVHLWLESNALVVRLVELTRALWILLLYAGYSRFQPRFVVR